ncbi:hypothetical protein N665_0383s0195 [Sinapis alba]|nr:hypothetical protein N665_0383s0195 [Sinapis alba]
MSYGDSLVVFFILQSWYLSMFFDMRHEGVDFSCGGFNSLLSFLLSSPTLEASIDESQSGVLQFLKTRNSIASLSSRGGVLFVSGSHPNIGGLSVGSYR